ncbi:hypothetical protein ACFQHO_45020 [Actinomadura yumaensis]|uniref:hypothetical protein n=1 Tax=Actinomadura yumaensis TaxID=111807 RepID=UPI00360C379D
MAETPHPPPAGFHVPQCRICGCTQNMPCTPRCRWVPDPALLGDLCDAHPEVLAPRPRSCWPCWATSPLRRSAAAWPGTTPSAT